MLMIILRASVILLSFFFLACGQDKDFIVSSVSYLSKEDLRIIENQDNEKKTKK